MTSCQCQGLEMLFNEKEARAKLKDYRANGPAKTTRILLDGLKAQGVRDLTLLDIGGGIGAIPHELLNSGAASARNVDASSAYIRAAKEESVRQGHAERSVFQHGNFVDLAPDIATVDVVTLDRVICCYDDMQTLVALSAERARKYYGLVFPKDSWWMRLFHPLLNFGLLIERNPMRTFIHATAAVDALLAEKGLKRIFQRNTILWQVMVYARV